MLSTNLRSSVFLLCLIVPLALGTKWLVDNPSFESVASWSSGALPCALEDVVFPLNYPAVMPLPKAVEIKGMILPRDGAILLTPDATIRLGGQQQQIPCENGNARKAYLKAPIVKRWFDPNSWYIINNLLNNKAVPTVERMPCSNESIVIHANGPLAIDLENAAFMRLGQLSLAGSMISKDYLQNLLNTDIGELLFKNTLGLRVEYYRNDICGCHRDYDKFLEPICHNVVHSCELPHCLVPITPLGSCCAMCGATIRFKMDKCTDAAANKLRASIAKALKAQQLETDLDYHVNYYDLNELGVYLQALVVDRQEYNERSVKFVQQLQESTDWKALFKDDGNLQSFYAGRPYNPNVTFASFLLIVLCLVFVGFVFLVIFAYYAPDNRYVRQMPQWLYDPRRWQAIFQRSHFVFARFDNIMGGNADAAAAASGNVQESIIMAYDAENDEVHERAFDNPMFGETSRRTVEATVEVNVVPADVRVESINLVDVIDADEEQELTEIKLDSASDDSDAEQETVK